MKDLKKYSNFVYKNICNYGDINHPFTFDMFDYFLSNFSLDNKQTIVNNLKDKIIILENNKGFIPAKRFSDNVSVWVRIRDNLFKIKDIKFKEEPFNDFNYIKLGEEVFDYIKNDYGVSNIFNMLTFNNFSYYHKAKILSSKIEFMNVKEDTKKSISHLKDELNINNYEHIKKGLFNFASSPFKEGFSLFIVKFLEIIEYDGSNNNEKKRNFKIFKTLLNKLNIAKYFINLKYFAIFDVLICLIDNFN